MNASAMARTWLLRIAAAAMAASAMPASATMCGTQNYPFPFTDVGGISDTFCRGILEAFILGITRGTTATTFSPNDNVPRVQMTTFLQRTFDQATKRTNRRAALEQWWVPRTLAAMQAIPVGGTPRYCAADGEHVWVSNSTEVVQVQASTGKVLGTWTGGTNGRRLVVAAGKVFMVQRTSPGSMLFLDPTQAPGPMAVAANMFGNEPVGMAFDGTRLWTANGAGGGPGSISIITLQGSPPYPASTITTGFASLIGALYDGTNIWVADPSAGAMHRLDAAGAILQSVPVPDGPSTAVFDGTNIWVPNSVANAVTVIVASTGVVAATIDSDAINLLNGPTAAAFDGERVLITNQLGDSVTLFKSADLSLIANVPTGTGSLPFGACSDGTHFWITLAGSGMLLRL